MSPVFSLMVYFEMDLNLEKYWVNVKCPTLLLRGAESDIIPARAVDVMRQSLPELECVEIPGVGHAPSLLFDSETRPILEWMGKRSSA